MCSDTSTWFNAVEALDGTGPGPSPLDMKLADVYSLLTPQFFPEDPNIITKQVRLSHDATHLGYHALNCAYAPHCQCLWAVSVAGLGLQQRLEYAAHLIP